ncbi:cytosine permease [Streptomyces sp. NBC_00878]|uniref:purine-cytosine permease family protein n=1 Tax=Streptomyces sp. NBC_00878 TaxID=2975854 RepID=UPI0022519644|nr:cytosine permease [Streptomyces sp. NBC_00878]MCX4904913.1 cytosine permease [Streptomyces sp. NBC_00878]
MPWHRQAAGTVLVRDQRERRHRAHRRGGASLGLSISWSLVAILAGGLFGTFFTAFHAAQGPQLGLPQMIQSRVQFGSRGLVHRIQRWLAILVLVSFGLVTVGVVAEVHLASLLSTGGFQWTAFLAQFGASAAYQIAIAPMVSDYTRYLPKKTGTKRVVGMVFLGSLTSATWLELLGATVATARPGTDTLTALQQYGDGFISGLGWVTLAVTVLSIIGVLPTSFYSAAINALSAIDAFRVIRPSVRSRVVVVAALTALTYLATVGIPDHYLGSFAGFLALLSYLLIPWTAVNLVDFYLVRHSSYAIAEILAPRGGVYGRWGARGLTAYAVGLATMVPFFSTALFTGPAAHALHGADISALIGLPVSSLCYWLLMRGADLTAERDLIALDQGRLTALNSGVPAATAAVADPV